LLKAVRNTKIPIYVAKGGVEFRGERITIEADRDKTVLLRIAGRERVSREENVGSLGRRRIEDEVLDVEVNEEDYMRTGGEEHLQRLSAGNILPGAAGGVEGLLRVQEISGYRVVGFIGRGGFADVYRARDKSGREVALKLYRGDDRVFVDEVGRVVGLANRLGIPYIVKILDYGVNPRPFIVMELYPTNLRELIRRGISPDDGLKLMRRVGVALAYAHRIGVSTAT